MGVKISTSELWKILSSVKRLPAPINGTFASNSNIWQDSCIYLWSCIRMKCLGMHCASFRKAFSEGPESGRQPLRLIGRSLDMWAKWWGGGSSIPLASSTPTIWPVVWSVTGLTPQRRPLWSLRKRASLPADLSRKSNGAIRFPHLLGKIFHH